MSFLDALGDLFSGSYNKLGGLTEDITDKSRVDQIFSGINYLQALSNFDRKSLRTHLNSGEFQYFPNNDPLNNLIVLVINHFNLQALTLFLINFQFLHIKILRQVVHINLNIILLEHIIWILN